VTWHYDGIVETMIDVDSVIDHVTSWVNQPVVRISPRVTDHCCNISVLRVLHAVSVGDSHVVSGAVVWHCCNTSNIIDQYTG